MMNRRVVSGGEAPDAVEVGELGRWRLRKSLGGQQTGKQYQVTFHDSLREMKVRENAYGSMLPHGTPQRRPNTVTAAAFETFDATDSKMKNKKKPGRGCRA